MHKSHSGTLSNITRHDYDKNDYDSQRACENVLKKML